MKRWPKKIVVGVHPRMGAWWVCEDPALILSGHERTYVLETKPKKPKKRKRRKAGKSK